MVKIAKVINDTFAVKKINKTKVKDTEFDLWYEYMRRWEGGYSNHPNDPGGETNKGITLKTFQKLAPLFGYSPDDYNLFLKMPDELHKKIAREAFWNPVAQYIKYNCISIFIVDYIWGSGAYGIKRIQRFLNKHFDANLKEDGIFGPNTAQAINKAANKIGPKPLLKEFSQIRRKHLLVDLMKVPQYRAFYNGWKNRLDDFNGVLNKCLKKKSTNG